MKKVFTTGQVAKICKVAPRTVSKWFDSGRLRGYRIPGSQDRRIPRVAGPCVLVMFGVTGDLASKKLLPAVYDLANRGLLPPGFVLLGFARRDWGDGDFEALAKQAAQEHSRTPWKEEVWARAAAWSWIWRTCRTRYRRSAM